MATARTLEDRMAGIARQIVALSRTPGEWDPDMLVHLDRLTATIGLVRDQAVTSIRESGGSDGEIARALGITRQAVSKRWPGQGRYVGAAGRYRKTSGTSPTTGREHHHG